MLDISVSAKQIVYNLYALIIKRLWIVVTVAVLLATYAFSLTLNYVEGDDASTFIYHALGRNNELQSPYAIYHAMTDKVLSLLPANEVVVRNFGILLSSSALILFTLFLFHLIFDWNGVTKPWQRLKIAAVLLVGVPEFFYLGLVFTPTIIAMSFLLLSQIILHLALLGEHPKRRWLAVVSSIVLYGVGVSFRWDTVLYGMVITADIIFWILPRSTISGTFVRRVTLGGLWGIAALSMMFIILFVLGYQPSDVFGLGNWASDFLHAPSIQALLSIQTLLTPLVVGLFIIGLMAKIRSRDSQMMILCISILLVSPLAATGIPKEVISVIPILLSIVVAGFLWLQTNLRSQLSNVVVNTALITIGLIPWVIGIQIRWGDSAWGPGFELQPFDRPVTDQNSARLVLFGDGAAISTSEGPRGLYGHLAILFGGKWKEMIDAQNAEISQAITIARDAEIPIVVLRGVPSIVIAHLLEEGYTTVDADTQERRIFSHPDNTEVTVIKLWAKYDLTANISTLLNTYGVENAILVAYSNEMREIYLDYPDVVRQKIGPESMVAVLTEFGMIDEPQ